MYFSLRATRSSLATAILYGDHRHVVRGAPVAAEETQRLDDAGDDALDRLAAQPIDGFEQPRLAELVALTFERLGHAVGIRDDDVARRHRRGAVRERRHVEHADDGTARRQSLNAAGSHEERRVVAGV